MPFYTYYMEDPPYCKKCGRTCSMMNHTRHGILCVNCVGKYRKGKKKKNTVQHSKPLRPGGYPFMFDKMIQPENMRRMHLANHKSASKDKCIVRQHRKRQRRVNEFLIAEALADMSFVSELPESIT